MGEKDRMVKAMNKAGGHKERPKPAGWPFVEAGESEAAELLRLRGLEGEIRKMLPLLELNRSTTGVAKRLKLLLGNP
jgi:hypothetical protein